MPYRLSENGLCVQEQQDGKWTDKQCYSEKAPALAYLRALEANVEDVHKMDNFSIFIPLVKVDEQQRMVYGRAAQEVPDGSREIMDYATSKPNFQKWSSDALARTAILPTDQRSLGNVRVMHEPYAAGKVTEFECNDMDKAFDVATYIHDDAAWEGVLKGIYTGFSIGGSYEKRWRDIQNPQLTRYTAKPVEISLVDAPAIPTATFKLIKADGTEELRKFDIPPIPISSVTYSDVNGVTNTITTVESTITYPSVVSVQKFDIPPVTPANETIENPNQPPIQVITEPVQDPKQIPVLADHFVVPDVIVNPSEPATQPLSEPVGIDAAQEGTDVLKAFIAAVNELAALKKAADAEKAKASELLKAIGARVGIARRESESLQPPTGYPTDTDDYADPANWRYPCDKANGKTSVAQFNLGKSRDKYSEREWHLLGRRIVQRVNAAAGTRYSYNPQTRQIQTNGAFKMADLNKGSINDLIPQIASALDVAVDQLSKDPAAAKEMLMQLIGSLNSSDNATPVNTSTPSPTAPNGGAQGDGMGKTGTIPPEMTQAQSVPSTTTSTTAPTMAQAEAAPSSSSSTTSTPTAIEKALMDKVDALTALVAKMAEPPAAPVQKAAAPMGDLAALIQQQPAADPIIAMLTSGDPYALKKAAVLAGSEGQPNLELVMQKVRQAAVDSLTPVINQMLLAHGLTVSPTFEPVQKQ